MTNGLNNGQMKIINILAWILITILIGYGAWLGNKFYDLKESLPREYVRLERYTCDVEKLEGQLNKIDGKLDRLIERHTAEGRRVERQSKKNQPVF